MCICIWSDKIHRWMKHRWIKHRRIKCVQFYLKHVNIIYIKPNIIKDGDEQFRKFFCTKMFANWIDRQMGDDGVQSRLYSIQIQVVYNLVCVWKNVKMQNYCFVEEKENGIRTINMSIWRILIACNEVNLEYNNQIKDFFCNIFC